MRLGVEILVFAGIAPGHDGAPTDQLQITRATDGFATRISLRKPKQAQDGALAGGALPTREARIVTAQRVRARAVVPLRVG
jgi:hypothetical protein